MSRDELLVAQAREIANYFLHEVLATDRGNQPVVPTPSELASIARMLPRAEARALITTARLRLHSLARDSPPPAPRFASWEDFMCRTPLGKRRAWCARKAHKANERATPDEQIVWMDVIYVMEIAKGRCSYCGSLAVETRPPTPGGGRSAPWAHIGRRIGSLDHRVPLIDGGRNIRQNLCWSCFWCNTWVDERRPGAIDHGGYYPA